MTEDLFLGVALSNSRLRGAPIALFVQEGIQGVDQLTNAIGLLNVNGLRKFALELLARITRQNHERKPTRRQRRGGRRRARPRQIGVYDRHVKSRTFDQLERTFDPGRHAYDLKPRLDEIVSKILGNQRFVLDDDDAGGLRRVDGRVRQEGHFLSKASVTGADSLQMRPVSGKSIATFPPRADSAIAPVTR